MLQNFSLKDQGFLSILAKQIRTKFWIMSQTEGGRSEKNTKMSEIQIQTFKNRWGVSIFQICLNYKLLSDPILKKKN